MRIKVVTLNEELYDKIENRFKDENPELIVPIGGDGTFIYAIQQNLNFVTNKIPVFGIANGTLNFLMNSHKVEDINKLLEYISERTNIDFIKTPILNYYINNKYKGVAINEVVYGESIRYYPTIKISTSKIDKNFQGSFISVSSPIGSTALNYNVGGKIIPMEYPIMSVNSIASNMELHERIDNEPIFITQFYERAKIAVLVDNHIKHYMQNNDVLKIEIGKYVTLGYDNYKEFEKKRVLCMINQ